MMTVDERKRVNVVSAVFFCWLLTVWAVWGYTPTNDGMGYLELADICLKEGQPYPTVSLFHYDAIPFIWNIGIINLTILSLWLSGSIAPLLFLLCAMKALTAWLLAKTTERLFSQRIAFVTLLLYICYPNNWGQSTMISSEIPADFLTMLTIFLVIKKLQKNGKKEHPYTILFLSGLLLAFSNWFRPTAPIFLMAIFVGLLYKYRNDCWRPLLTLLTGYAVFILVVGTSTFLRTGHFVYQARSLWFSMIDECYDGAPVAPHWGQPIWPEGYPRYIENHEQLDCFECERIWRQRSIDWLKDHKMEYLKKIPSRIYYMYQSDYDYLPAFLPEKVQAENNYITLPYRHLLSEATSLSSSQWMALLTMVYYTLLLLASITGTWMLFRQRCYDQLLLPLLIIVGGTLLLTIVMHGETRFKTPLMPWLFMLAGAGISFILKDRKKDKQKIPFRRLLLLPALFFFGEGAAQRPDVATISQQGLPVLIINTINAEEPTCDYVFAPEGAFGISITNATKVPGRCMLIEKGNTLFDSGEYEKDQSGMTLKIRGNTSAYYWSKKPFKLKLEKKGDLLARGNPRHDDKNWVLLKDGDVIFQLLGNEVNRLMGMPWTPATQYINLFINGDYRGLYILIEQVKRNADCRINVDKKTGYLIERDAYWWNEDPYFKTEREGKEFTFKYPEPEDITDTQLNYIHDYLNNFETALAIGTYTDYIDLRSWAAWLLAHDILGTKDSGGANLYLTKYDNTPESRLQMSTLWDFGSIMRTTDQWSSIHTDQFFYYNNLLNNENTAFNDAYVTLWEELKDTIFTRLQQWVDNFEQSDMGRGYAASLPYDYARWDYDDGGIEPNLTEVRQWLTQREKWLREAFSSIPTSIVEQLSTDHEKTAKKAHNLLGQPVNPKTYHGFIIKDGRKYKRY